MDKNKFNPLDTLLKVITLFITVIIISIVLYSFIFGYISYKSYLRGYAYQNWCSEDYTEFASIRFHYLSQIPNIVAPIFTLEYILFFIYSIYQFQQYSKNNKPTDIWSTTSLKISFGSTVLSYGVLISMLGVMIANQIKPIKNYKTILDATPSSTFPVFWIAVLIAMFLEDTEDNNNNHLKLTEYITYAAYLYVLLFFLFYTINIDYHKIENIIKKSWIVILFIVQTIVMVSLNADNFNINTDVGIQRILEFFMFILGVIIGLVLFDKTIIGSKQKNYKQGMMKLNLIISDLLGQDIEIKGVSGDPLTSIELSSLYPRDNISFINLFGKSTSNQSNQPNYESMIDSQIRKNDAKLRGIRSFMKIFQDKLLEIIHGTITDSFISKEDINDLRRYNSVYGDNPDNALTSLRKEFIYYIENADRIELELLTENTKYSEFVDSNILHRIIINEYNQINPSSKDISGNVLRSFYITDGKNDYKFYFVGGSISDTDIFEKSSRIRDYNNNRNNKKLFIDENDMLEELANTINTINLPCSYLSYYNGDLEKFKIKLENLKYNVKKIDKDIENQLSEAYGRIDNDDKGINWNIMLFSFIMGLIVIYLIFVNMFAYTNMASTIIIIMVFILLFILSYSLKIIVNNQ